MDFSVFNCICMILTDVSTIYIVLSNKKEKSKTISIVLLLLTSFLFFVYENIYYDVVFFNSMSWLFVIAGIINGFLVIRGS
ncbi:hypothetical protein [Floccifex sp.]|uniref:hypothetical protein n=1 Tax=Floccifex sp. TaxID=2815810 RepID=UPI003F094D30